MKELLKESLYVSAPLLAFAFMVCVIAGAIILGDGIADKRRENCVTRMLERMTPEQACAACGCVVEPTTEE